MLVSVYRNDSGLLGRSSTDLLVPQETLNCMHKDLQYEYEVVTVLHDI